MAQDFWKQFHLGEDSLSVSTIDPSGIALAAIQELAKKNEKLENRNEKLEQEVAAHNRELAELRAAVQSLQAQTKQTSNKGN